MLYLVPTHGSIGETMTPAKMTAALRRRLTSKYPQLTVRVSTGTSAITLADDYDLEGIRAEAFIITLSCTSGTFTEAIPVKGQTIESAMKLIKMYADDLASDEDRERAIVLETVRMTGANV